MRLVPPRGTSRLHIEHAPSLSLRIGAASLPPLFLRAGAL
jgi:hypothetical protein